MKSLDPLYRNSFFIVVSNTLNAIFGFLFWLLAAWLYPIKDVGIATAIISSLGLIILFSRLGFDTSIIRFFAAEDKNKIISTSLMITTIASILVGCVYLYITEYISLSQVFIQTPFYNIAFVLIVIVNSIVSTTGSIFLADKKADYYLYQNIVLAFRLLFLIPLAMMGYFGIIGSFGFAYLLASLLALILLDMNISQILRNVDKEFIKKSFKFSSWSYISNILGTAPTFVLPLIIFNQMGALDAAIFYVAFAIGNLISIIPVSLGTSIFIQCSHGDDLRESVHKAGFATFLGLMPIIITIFIFGDKILGFFNENYLSAFDLLKMLAISSLFVSVYALFIPIQNVRMKIECIAKLNLVRCMMLIGLTYILTINYGINGAGFAWIITYTVIALIVVGIAKKEKWILYKN